MDADGNNPKQLTSGNTESNFAQISPDGQWVIYTQIVSTGAQNVWKVSIDGGTPVQLTDKDSLRPSISPDGKMIACWQIDNQPNPTWHIALIPFAGGPPLKLLEIPPGEAASWGQPLFWSLDGSAVTYVDQLNAVNNVWSQPIDGGKPTQLTDFKSDQIFSFNWSRDGKLVLSRGVSTSDVIMISDSP
jgi:Periplasmic component of the Tol biopolymer transport system